MDIRNPFFKNVAALLAAVMFLNPVVVLGADLALDATAGGNASLGRSGNGVPIVNIAAPNSNGLSHNRFNEYNVGQQGLILNNATQVAQPTQLGGMILGNTNLNGRAAGLILNEVTGVNASQLKGYTEVAGQAAGVIVANPHGISCDGCGFINTPQVTLSTGKPVLENGNLRQFDVDQGEILIHGAGLNASNIDQFNLITRSARINAELHANELNIIAGRNHVDASTLAATAKADSGAEKPLLAIDSSVLGGMYAGAIRLVGTEHGVGVRLAGDMAASAGDMHIDAAGKVSLGRLATTGDLNITAQDINLTQGYARGDVQLSADRQIDITSSLASGGAQRIQGDTLHNHSIIETGVALDGSRLAGASIHIDASRVGNAGLILASGDLTIQAQELDNSSATIAAQDTLQVTVEQLDNSRVGTLSSQGDLSLAIKHRLDNSDEGAVVSGKDMHIQVGELDNSQHGLVVASGVLDLQVESALDNQTGSLVAAGDLQLQAGALDNRQGDVSAGETLQASITGALDNRAGILAATTRLELQAAALDNREQGQLVSEADFSLRADQLANDGGTIYAQGQAALQVDGQLDNRDGGLLLADTGMTLRAADLDNRGGVIQTTAGTLAVQVDNRLENSDGLLLAGDGALRINASEVYNQRGIISSLKGLVQSVGGWLINRGGTIEGQQVSLQASDVLNNDLGHIAATTGNLDIAAQRVSNMHGALFARQLLSINAEQLNNNDSLLALFMNTGSGYGLQEWIDLYRQMLLTDWEGFVAQSLADGLEPFLGDTSVTRKYELLAVLDMLEQSHPDAWQQGSLIHAERIQLDVDQLSQTVTSQILAEGELQASGRDWINHGFIASDGELSLALRGHYDSYGTLASVGAMNVQSNSLALRLGDEDIGGILGGSDVDVKVAGLLSNDGQLTAMADLAVEASQIDNVGVLGAADQLKISGNSLYNRFGLLFSGHNLLLQVNQLVNHDADIYSLAGLSLSGRNPATRAQRLDNLSGTIESAGDMQLRVDSLNNQKEVFREEQVQLEGALTVRCYDCSGDHHNVDYIGREVFESRVTEDSPAALLHSGGQLSIDAGAVANRFSTLSASGDLNIRANTVQNLGAVGARTERTRTWNTGRTTDGTDERFRWNYINPYNAAALPKVLPLAELGRYSLVSDISLVTAMDANAPAVIQAGGNLLIQATQHLENSRQVGNELPAWHDDPTRNEIASVLQDIIKVQLSNQLPPDLRQQQVNPLTLPGFSLPDGQQGMFRLVQSTVVSTPGNRVNAPAPGSHRYLIETNPALTGISQFLGSDYLLGQLGLNPDLTLKRLGDGLYEQRLIREAVTARTGARYLAGLTSDEAMYRFLMDNALASKDALHLTLGISLTAEQVAALTHDIVWLEEHQVMGEKVLVPVLYLAQAEGRLAPSGALMQGQQVTLISGGDLHNQGTLRATGNLGIVAENIDNRGLLQAHERLQLIAQDSVRNAHGGIISGNSVALHAAGDILNERTATAYGTGEAGQLRTDLAKASGYLGTLVRGRAHDSGTILDSAARIEAAGDLDVHAGGSLSNQGSVLQAGGDANLSAGQNLIIGSVEEHSSSTRNDRRHHWETSQVTQHGSEVSAEGDLHAGAGNDLAIIASRVEAGGDIQMIAENNLIITSAANEAHSEYRYRSSNKKITSEDSIIDQQGAELRTGGDISLVAGEDLIAIASRIEAAQQAYLVAGNQLALLAAENLDHSFYEKKKKGSFGRKSFRSDQVTRISQQGTEITSGGDLALISGGDQRYQAAELTSGVDIDLISGGAIEFEGVKDLHQERHEKSSSSWIWQSAKGEGNTDETLIQSRLIAQGELALRAAEGIQIDLRDIDQHTVSQTIDAMAQADPNLGWLKEMEQRGDVDWRLVKELHDSFSYSQSGLSGPAAMIIAIVVAYFTAGAASGLVAGMASGAGATVTAGTAWAAATATTAAGWANVAVTAAITSAASGAAVSTINNGGNLGDVLKDVLSEDALKGYVASAITAGATSGILDSTFGADSDIINRTASGFELGTAAGLGDFATYLGAQGTLQAITQTAIVGGSLEDNLQSALTNQVHHLLQAGVFHALGDFATSNNWADGGPEKTALHAVVGGMLSEATGGDFATGALAAGANEALIEQLSGAIKGDKTLEQAVSQLIGIAAATVTDGDYAKAAELAKNATAYNRQLHIDEIRFASDEERVKRYAEQEGIPEEQARQELLRAGAAMVDHGWTVSLDAAGALSADALLFLQAELQGSNSGLFQATAPEYFDERLGLKELLSNRETVEALVRDIALVDPLAYRTNPEYFHEVMNAKGEGSQEGFGNVVGAPVDAVIWAAGAVMCPSCAMDDLQAAWEAVKNFPEDLSYKGYLDTLHIMQGGGEDVIRRNAASSTELGIGLGLGAAPVGTLSARALILQRLDSTSVSDNTAANRTPAGTNKPGGRHTQGETDDFYQTLPDGTYHWPENIGFAHPPRPAVLEKGAILDRYGDNSGSFLSPEGVPFEQRALGPGDGDRAYRRYEVLKPLPILEGEIAPAFGKPGGGTQFLPNFAERVNIDWLIQHNYLRELD